MQFGHTVYFCYVPFQQWTLLTDWCLEEIRCVFCDVRTEFLHVWRISMHRLRWIKLHWGRFFSCYFILPRSVSFHQWSVHIFISKLLFVEGRAGGVWVSSNRAVVFRIYGSADKSTSAFSCCGVAGSRRNNGTVNEKLLWTIRSFLCKYWLFLMTMCRGDMPMRLHSFCNYIIPGTFWSHYA